MLGIMRMLTVYAIIMRTESNVTLFTLPRHNDDGEVLYFNSKPYNNFPTPHECCTCMISDVESRQPPQLSTPPLVMHLVLPLTI